MPDAVRIRMYDVGFGDCFVLEFPRSDADEQRAPFRVLVDCGAHRSGYPRLGWQPEDAAAAVVEDLREAGAPPRLNVVVATHRHQDHVSGFAAAVWRDVEVGQVWMPWTEHPTDEEATEIRNRQSRLPHGLHQAFADGSPFAARWAGADGEPLRAMAANSLTNESAMRTLHHGSVARRSASSSPPPRPRCASSPPTARTSSCTSSAPPVTGT